MNLDEAIRHAEEMADKCDGQCSIEHEQLAKWLQELKDLRNEKRLNEIIKLGYAYTVYQGELNK